jgi:cellulose synthase/poly-beta-1,6-N-acetylglucosamine synthase-like glycosyltransferase
VPSDALPFATVAVPTRNEGATIESCLRALAAQDYPASSFEVLVLDGASTDDTGAKVERFAQGSPLQVRVVENPARSVPGALNRALELTTATYLVRVDGHSEPSANYLRACIAGAERLQAGLAGGWVEPRGTTPVGRAVAAAFASPFSMGNATSWREPDGPHEVVSVPCGAYRVEALRAIGGFDEGQLANQDYEANLRLRAAGWPVYILPDVHFTYVTRATLARLARQFARYGYFRARTLVKHPGSARARQLVPPLAILAGLALVATAAVVPIARIVLAAVAVLYVLVLVAAAVRARRGLGRDVVYLPAVFATMHLAWGAGSLVGLVRWLPVRRRLRASS